MKSKLSGWKDVFCFTLTQTLKSKAFLVSFVVLVVLALAASPVMGIISRQEENDKYTIKKLYLSDETGIFNKETARTMLVDAGWNVQIETVDIKAGSEQYKELIQKIDDTEAEAVVLTLGYTEQGLLSLYLEYSSKGDVSKTEVSAFQQVLLTALGEARYSAAGLSAEQKSILYAGVFTNILSADTEGNISGEADTSISDFEYWFLYALLFILMMICMMTGSQVATSIVTEKSSKVVEYLLTSIRPLAIIVGKVLAMLCVVLTEVVGLIVIFAVSNYITGQGTGQDMMAQLVSPKVLGALNPLNIVLCLVFIAFGLVFYATLAGLAGATVSKIEEAGEGLMVFSLTLLIGVYVGIGAAGSLLGAGDNPFAIFAMLFPLSSPFLMPGAILIGKAQIWIIAVSFILLALLVLILFAVVAKVYEALIVYNGNRVKLKQLFKMKS